MDLAKHLGVTDYSKQCPILVFIPSSYADEVGDDYLRNPSTEHIQIWNRKPVADPPTLEWVQSVVFSDGTTESAVDEKLDWKTWVWQNMMQTVRISVDIPFDFQITVMHQTQNSYLKVIEKPWSEIIKIDAIQSFTELQVFPGTNVLHISKRTEVKYTRNNSYCDHMIFQEIPFRSRSIPKSTEK